jgi:RNA polymerase sigma-70 factor (ECF subfamily)
VHLKTTALDVRMKRMPAATETGIFDESGLVARAREGDLTAFNELVNRYSRKIYRLAKHITQNDEDAEDVLQETFLNFIPGSSASP